MTHTTPFNQDVVAIFAALGDPNRLKIVAQLQESTTRSISALCASMDISRQAVSKHLKLLAEAKLVSAVKSGREMQYRLEREGVAEAQAFLLSVEGKWDEALKRLKSHVE